jgi:hypothetical protein
VNTQIVLSSTAIFPILVLLIHKHGMSFHSFVRYLPENVFVELFLSFFFFFFWHICITFVLAYFVFVKTLFLIRIYLLYREEIDCDNSK